MLKGILVVSGNVPLIILYGIGNFDGGKRNKKLLGFSLLNVLWITVLIGSFLSASVGELISAIALLVSYPLILILCGIYNRKHKKTSYTIIGKLELAKQIPQENKTDYLENKASKEVIAFCEEHKGNNKDVYFYLLKALEKGNLNQTKAEVIWEKYKVDN